MIGGCSVLLDGVNDYVDLGTVAARDFTSSDFSLLAWIYPRSFPTWHSVITHGSLNTSGYGLNVKVNGELWFSTSSPTASYTGSAPGAILANKWQHVAAVRKGSAAEVYVNGERATSHVETHSNPVASAGATAVGANVGGAADRFNGAIDEPAFFNVALTQQQIREYMRLSIPASAPGLVSLHHFDDGLSNFASTTAVAAVSGVNGTLQNGATWVFDRWAPWIEERITASGDLAVSSATAAAVPGTLRNFIPRVSCKIAVLSQWDFLLTTAGSGAIIGEMQVNGAARSGVATIVEPAGAVLSRGQHFALNTETWTAETLYAIEMLGKLSAGGDAMRGTFKLNTTRYAIFAQPIDGTW